MSDRTKLRLCSFGLLLALGITAVLLANTLQAVTAFQQQNHAIQVGDVRAMRPWMTLAIIAHLYRVPEPYLERTLRLSATSSLRTLTLYDIAARQHQSVAQILHVVQQAVLTYRHDHLRTPQPTLFPRPQGRVLSSIQEERHT